MEMRQSICRLVALLMVVAAMLQGNPGMARPTYFDANCIACHTDDTPTCNGCHHHGQPRVAITDLAEYAPGTTVTVIVGGSVGSGWNRMLLYDHNGVEVARATGPTGTGDDGSGLGELEYPFALTAPAPLLPGVYTWEVAWWGSPYDTGNHTAFPHGEGARLQTTEFTVLDDGSNRVEAAEIDVLPVSPRDIDEDPNDDLDVRASGLEVVGINKQVYLVPAPLDDYASSITGYSWSVLSEPSAGAAVVDLDTPELFKFHGTAGGAYVIQLTPTVIGATGLPVTKRIYAAKYVGTGTEGSNIPNPPNCGTSACHGDSQADGHLNKITDWQGTGHAHMLENFLNGTMGGFYSVSCLECHTLGYDEVAMDNDNFYEISQDISFDLNQIPTWVADAFTSGNPHWNDLPAELQLKSNIQCEQCHGPGSDHNGDRTKIVGAEFDAKACRQCHDAPTHHMHVEQWENSGHPHTLSSDHQGETSSCQPCHTTEGFLFVRGKGEPAIPAEVESRNSLNCVGCHDPHDDSNPHQLRTVAAVTLPDGTVYDGGLGNTCANCHNARYAAADRVGQSYRGAHHGPMADVIMGTAAYDWGTPYAYGEGVHRSVVTNTCVDCHMAENTSDTLTPILGGHTWTLNANGFSNAEAACGSCHQGLTTTDRVPLVPTDYDGDGAAEGMQTEVGNLLMNVRDVILASMTGTAWDPDEQRISISSADFDNLTFDQQAALYNFNVCSEDKSKGIHNAKYVIAVLQRAYGFTTGNAYDQDFPQSTVLDDYFAPIGSGPGAAEIDLLAIGPRTIDEDPNDLFDARSSGLPIVGVGKTMYFAPKPHSEFDGRISDYDWNITAWPQNNAATVDSETSSMFKIRPTVAGEYEIQLIPRVDGAWSTPTTQRVLAAAFVGTGTEGSNTATPPNCGVEACHGSAASGHLNKIADWQGTGHAHMLENFLNGTMGGYYSVSCLECHTLGYDEVTMDNDNFHEISQDISFDLSQIPTWVADAFTSGNPHWDDLPAELQLKSNIQCEECHGPGSMHSGNKANIIGAVYEAKQCIQCHDAPTHHMHVQQWENSGHPHTLSSDHQGESSSCQPCHTTEGFLFVRGEGQAGIPAEVESRNSLNCVGCHDPHDDSNPHQLRTVAAVTLPDGTVYDGGLGNTCANCHNARYAAADRVGQSYRGAHHGPMADVIMGVAAYDWGTPYAYGVGIHANVVTNTCVDCHMAENTSDTLTPILGGHTWALNADGFSNAEAACGSCHQGLTTTDRVPLAPTDYDGDGAAEGMQTEVGNLLANVRDAILASMTGTAWDPDEQRISIGTTDYDNLTTDQQGALYNFNVCSEDKSKGIHNAKYVIAVLQRAYGFTTGNAYGQDYPQATVLDDYFVPAEPSPGASEIDILAIGPRTIDEDPNDLFDARSSGLPIVGVGKTMYFAPKPESEYESRISDYNWKVTKWPVGHGPAVDNRTSSVFKIRPVWPGEYEVELTPRVDGLWSTPTTQRVLATKFVGTGTEGSNTPSAPNCGVEACHGSAASGHLNKIADWQGTGHAHMLENFLNGTMGGYYSVSCLECHTLGYDEVTMNNDNFHEISQDISFDLSQIPTWVADAFTSGNPHWDDLPAELQLKSNIQCEECHGPGYMHSGNKNNIVGAVYDAKQCIQCHDAPTHHMHVQQWENSGHPHTLSSDHQGESSSCQPCHTTEGFLFVRGEGEPGIPEDVESRNSLNCVGCHDPHDDSNPHQLRTVAPVTLPDGTVFDGGLGNTCANCHNARYAAADRVGQSYRGAHHGPMADVLMGTAAYDWGVPYPVSTGIHANIVTNTCVDCHMAENTSDTLTPILGGHTWALNANGFSNAEAACGGCHQGLTTTDRVPLIPTDYDGDGAKSGMQTEVGNLLANVRDAILANMPGTEWDDEEQRISISGSDYDLLTFNMQAALYNFNVCSEDKSKGIHNAKYVIAVLQRAYRFATGHPYADDYPNATILDNYSPVRPNVWPQYR